jgi:hypothetical protein
MTADALLTTETMLDAFAAAGRVLPHIALAQAADRWPEIGPTLLAKLQAAADGTDRSERTNRILFFGIYLMAQVRETRAFRPLCTIAADGDRIFQLIGDGVTEDLSLILTRVYDGQPTPLRELIEAAGADEYTRNSAIGALAWLTAAGRIHRDETTSYLRDLHTTLRPQSECYVWVGWQRAIGTLALDELVPLVEKTFERGWIDLGERGRGRFHSVLQLAHTAEPAAVFERHIVDDGRLDDAVRHLSGWAAFRSEEPRMPKPRMSPEVRASGKPLHYPNHNVGRNDPCPCGSRKKFKKCCRVT